MGRWTKGRGILKIANNVTRLEALDGLLEDFLKKSSRHCVPEITNLNISQAQSIQNKHDK